ncbi:hypothetical protein Q1695_015502 [Nippostrongylus brasiliensis]|nr:hypothetical protein Q1695_015502 [Nippostrongylus brasiliensis]
MSEQECAAPSTVESSRHDIGPGLHFFSRFATAIVKLVVRFSDEESIELMIKSLMERSTSGTLAWEILKNNILVFCVFFLTILCAIIVLITCIGILICRWSSKDEGTPNNGRIWCAGVMFVLCALVTMVCLILVLSTAISIRTAITAIPGQVNSSAIYVENFTVQLDTYITCTYNKQLDDMSDVVEKSAKKIKKEVHTLHGAIDKYEKSPKNYKAVFNATQLRNGLAMLEKEIDTFGGQRRAIHKTFENVLSNSLSSVFTTITNFVAGVSAQSTRFLENTTFVTYMNWVFLGTVAVPLILLLLCLFSLTLLLLRALFNLCVKDPESGKRGLLSRFGGEVMGAAGYVAMGLTVLLFIFAALAFLCAFAAVMVCVGFFEDKNLRVFRYTDEIFMDQRKLNIRVSDIFYKCKNGYTFFDAMDGASIMAESEMKDKIHFLSIRDAQAEIEKGVDDDDTIVDYKMIQTDTEEGKLCHLIGRIVSKDLRDDVSAINEKVKSTAENLVNSLVDMSPSCENIMVLWNDIGYFVCKVGAQPLSGIWLASLITAFVSILIYQAIFDATKYLKSFSTSSE